MIRLALRRPNRAAAEMDDEIAFHLAARVEQLITHGWTPEAARAEAYRRFGPYEETMRGLRRAAREREETLRMIDAVRDTWQDLRFGMRMLRRYPGFAAGAVLTLALGVGAACSMFAVVNHTLFSPLPFAAQDRLVFMGEEFKPGEPMMVSYPNFSDWREQAKSFDAVEAVTGIRGGIVLGGDAPVFAHIQNVSRGLLPMLGVKPIVGRWIAPDENRAGAQATVMVSEDFWREHLGATTNLTNVELSVYDAKRRVVGVMPRTFTLFGPVDIWFPLEIDPVRIRAAGNYLVLGRLRRGVPLARAEAEMNRIAARLKATYGNDSMSSAVFAEPLRELIIGDARRPLVILLAAAAFVLLVTCVNVAMMLLARASARSREVAVRVALGSGRWRLVRQSIAETSILVAAGIGFGLLIAWRGIAAVRVYGVGQVPRAHDLSFDASVAVAAAVIATLVVAIFSVAPVLAAGRISRDALGSASLRVSRPSRSWSMLLGVQAAATVILVVGATLIMRTVLNILHTDVGYDAHYVTAVTLPLTADRYNTDPARERAAEAIERALGEALPGSTIGLASGLPTDRGVGNGPLLLPPITNPNSQKAWAAIASTRFVTPSYFSALKIRLLEGRMFDASDRDGSVDVALVNQSLARKLWPGQDPLGKRVRALVDPRGALFTVVGVVADARDWRRSPGSQIELYVPFAQRPSEWVDVVIRSMAPEAKITEAARRVLHDADPNLVLRITTLTGEINDTMADRRFIAGILVAFAVVVLALTIIGTFGSMSYAVAMRRREIGIRLAIGATPRRVWLGVERQTVITVATGAVAGIAAAWIASRTLAGLLYGISVHDRGAFALAPLLVCLAGVLGAAWPAFRAARTDPSESLRLE